MPFTDRYNKNLYEGEDITTDFFELDTISFSYYGTNYSVRVLSVYSTAATVRVGNKALEISLGETHEFDLDGDDLNDLNVTVVSLSQGDATLNLALKKLPEEEPEEPVQNITNTTASQQNSANSTPSIQQNSSSAPKPSSSSAKTASNSSAPKSSSTKQQSSSSQQPKTEATGDVVYNINIDISIPPGSGIGVLLIIAIVLGGLVVYKRVRHKFSSEDEEISILAKEKSAKPGKNQEYGEEGQPGIWDKAKKLAKRVAKKISKALSILRIKIAGFIAGKDVHKLQSQKLKGRKSKR